MLHCHRVHPAVVLLVCFASAVSLAVAGNVGVNYGILANNLPSPLEVAQMLLTTPLRNVKLYTADQATLQAFAHAGLKVAVGVPNQEILLLASNLTIAEAWVRTNVVAYMPATQFNYIIVGNEVLTVSPELSTSLVPAMTNLHTALVNLQLAGQVKISTPHNFAVIGYSFPPSVGTFNSNVSTTMQAVLAFLSQTNSSFMVNAYPYYAYIANPANISLAFATFQQPNAAEITDINTGLQYTNMLDAQLDSVFSAMERLGYHDIPITISETGWPSSGDTDEIGWGVVNAQTYNGNLIKYINSNVGTPLRPGASIDAFIFALFNEDLKPGPATQRNFGLFNPDEIAVYNVGLVEFAGEGPVFPSPPSSSPGENTSPPASIPGWSATTPSYNPPSSEARPPASIYYYPPPAPSVPNAHPSPIAYAPTVWVAAPPTDWTAPSWTTTTPLIAPVAYGSPNSPSPVETQPAPGAPAYGPSSPVQTQPVGKTWCVAKPGADEQNLMNALNYACGQGAANCVPIQPGNECYEPDSLASHASYAFNSYYQLNGRNYWNCYFGDSGIISITDPSYDRCPFP